MRHKLKRHRINRFTSWRKATLKSLVKSVLFYESIRTTKGKALLAQPLVDKLIGMARVDSLANKRRAFSILGDHALVTKLFGDIARRFDGKVSGFTRMINMGLRRGDSASVVILELTEIKKKVTKHHKVKKEAAVPAEPSAAQGPAPGETPQEGEAQVKKPETKVATVEKERPPVSKKPSKNFLGGLRRIFKKERDSL